MTNKQQITIQKKTKKKQKNQASKASSISTTWNLGHLCRLEEEKKKE